MRGTKVYDILAQVVGFSLVVSLESLWRDVTSQMLSDVGADTSVLTLLNANNAVSPTPTSSTSGAGSSPTSGTVGADTTSSAPVSAPSSASSLPLST